MIRSLGKAPGTPRTSRSAVKLTKQGRVPAMRSMSSVRKEVDSRLLVARSPLSSPSFSPRVWRKSSS